MSSFRNLLITVIAIAAVAGYTLGGASFHTPPTVSESVSSGVDSDDNSTPRLPGGDSVSVEWSHGRYGSNANAEEHWRKHGGDFSEDRNAQEYENEASNFVHHPPPDAEIKHRANGDTLIYDRGTNTFAVENRDGEPRTMFKPDRGRDYWDRRRCIFSP